MDIIVRNGDSLWYYSQLFQINFQLILDSNREVCPNQLLAGQRVRIPGFLIREYQMQPGDSFSTVANQFGVPLDTVLLVNPYTDPDHLLFGQVINVPQRVTWRVVQGKQSYDYSRLVDDVRNLLLIYPFIQVSAIGNSVLGRHIPEVVIGCGSKRVHYNGSFHANEWITTAVIMTFMNDYLLALTNNANIRGIPAANLYLHSFLSTVPMVNPDGVELVLNGPPENETWRNWVMKLNKGNTDFSGWKANIRGVDLNDQFPAKWEVERARNPKEPSPRDYGGERPLSEPEAFAMAELTRYRDFARVLAFHTQGKVMYWGIDHLEPPESTILVEEFSRVSGYEPVRNIESYAGYKDWFIQEWRRPGFTIELGSGVNPLPLNQFDEIYRDSLGIFLAGIYM